ncbi:UNVERIFIED_CONTAM: hypothetical protein RMT77_006707 [Armadillidium vulgare]
MAITRSDISLWFLEKSPVSVLSKSRLPSKMDVFLLFFYHHRVLKKTDSQSAKDVITSVLEIWNRANLDITTTLIHVFTKLKALDQRYRNLQKNKTKIGANYDMQRDVFLADLEDIFDIARRDVLD